MKIKDLDTHPAYGGGGPIDLVFTWLESALKCPKFLWDHDQYDAAKETLADARALLDAEVPEPVAALTEALSAARIAGYVDMTPAAVILDLHTQLNARGADNAPGLGVAIKWHEKEAQRLRNEADGWFTVARRHPLLSQAVNHDNYAAALRKLLTEPELIA